MSPLSPILAVEAAELLADSNLLSQQVGSPEGLAALSQVTSLLKLKPVADVPGLQKFLSEYQEKVLLPLELPCILKAYQLAAAGQVRELVEFDRYVGKNLIPEELVLPSRCVGQRQLRRLRPLKDHRVVQRYLQALEQEKAFGWHTFVYGLILAVYTVPIRQGLLHYARQTQVGFLQAAAASLRLTQGEFDALETDITSGLAQSVEHWFSLQQLNSISVV